VETDLGGKSKGKGKRADKMKKAIDKQYQGKKL